MESPKRRRGRPATGRSQESLEIGKLNRSIWSGARSRVWMTKRIHNTWKFLKGMSLFNSDNDFAAHLLSLETARLQRLNRKGMQTLRMSGRNKNRRKSTCVSGPVTSTPGRNRPPKRSLFMSSPEMSPYTRPLDLSVSESNKSCSIRYHRKYNQRTKHWDVVAQKSDKDYSYIPMLTAKIFKMRQNDTGSMQDYMEMSLNDPRRIAPTIAATNPLPTSELVARHRSRFSS